MAQRKKYSGYDRRADEWYIEPEWCVRALMAVEDFDLVYDPACGCGTIPKTFIGAGIDAIGTDLVDRGYGLSHDFLNHPPLIPAGAQIVTNPPYDRGKLVVAFIDRALALGHTKVCAIVNESFLFSAGRKHLFEKWPLARIWFLSDRPSMPPGELLTAGKVQAKGGTANYCWLVFDRDHSPRNAPRCGWIGKAEAKLEPIGARMAEK